MDELRDLIKQRDELNKKIQAIKNRSCSSGKARLFMDPNYHVGEEWKVSIEYTTFERSYNKNSRRSINYPICRGDTKKEALEQIPEIIRDLQALYEKAKAEG